MLTAYFYINSQNPSFFRKIFIFVLLCFVTGTLTTTLNTIKNLFTHPNILRSNFNQFIIVDMLQSLL